MKRKPLRTMTSTESHFEEGITVFHDPLSISIDDPGHSANEQRYIDIGASENGRVLVVSYTERGKNIRHYQLPQSNEKRTETV